MVRKETRIKHATRCCGRDGQVMDSRPTGTGRNRRRRCKKCKRRWSTHEVILGTPIPQAHMAKAEAAIADARRALEIVAEKLAELEVADERDG